jgi:hypothetical protein
MLTLDCFKTVCSLCIIGQEPEAWRMKIIRLRYTGLKIEKYDFMSIATAESVEKKPRLEKIRQSPEFSGLNFVSIALLQQKLVKCIG